MNEEDLGSATWTAHRGDGQETMLVRKCRLEVVAGPDAGSSHQFASPVLVIGRSGSDLVLSDRRVSALHAEIRLEPDGYRVRDLGSTNGTYAWGMKIVEAFIGPGTTLVVGDSAVRFVPLPEAVEMPLWASTHLCGLVGRSPAMRRLFDTIDRVASTDATALVTGETGTGKELVAEALHERSARSGRPFVVLDCSAVPVALFEDHLFGHEAGSFTGAGRATAGVFEEAHGGTLFIDEVGELPQDAQAKLLRAVETRRVRRLGGVETIDCDVRLIAATNRNLAAEMNRGNFRADLYFRLAVARLNVPPLRERLEDIDLLTEHFLAQHPRERAALLPDDFLTWARAQMWPGNVRELRNALERAITTHPEAGWAPEDPVEPPALLDVDVSLPFRESKARIVEAFERRYATRLLETHEGNISAVARSAGLDRMSVYKLLDRLRLRGRWKGG
ncbi:MAG TPA: sigma 54-interacting transcriptional regulator [Kofleriaceae bacterium]|nr:sigma 54-interacting transcriptional regulator [Kofleriaceae bacterium]